MPVEVSGTGMNRKQGFITRQAERLSAGEINRRRFVMQALSAGVTMPTAMSLASRAEAKPRKGGLFRYATRHTSLGDTLNPDQLSHGLARLVFATQGNSLTEIAWDGSIKGALADQIEPDADAKSWVFTLRRDVEFHHGKTLTAEDVIASLTPHRNSLLSDIASIRQSDKWQVVIDLEKPNRGFDRLCADERLTIQPSRDGRLGNTDRHIGTGAYVLDRFDPKRGGQFTRNPNYWKPGAAHFDAINLRPMPDPTARLHAVMNGDVDYADGIDPKAVAVIRHMPTLDTHATKGTKPIVLSAEAGSAELGNSHLRLALQYALRRQELVDKVLLGHGIVATEAPLNGADPTPIEFDAARASDHYAKSGHRGPIALAVSDAEFAGAMDAARLMAASAGEAGIVLQPTSDPSDGTGLRLVAQSGSTDDIIPVRANEIAAHSKALMHSGKTATHAESDGYRIAERWWFQ